MEGLYPGLIDGKIIAAFGFEPLSGDTSKTRLYDIATDTWSAGATAPKPRRSEGTAVTNKKFLFAIGGRANVVRADLDRYEPATDTWVSLADMPTARAGLASARVAQGIYAIGGRKAGGGPCSQRPAGTLDTVERFNIASGTWSTLSSLPTPRSDVAAAAVNGKVYVFGGCTVDGSGIHFLADVDVFDPSTNTWDTSPADLPTPRAAFYQVAAIGTSIYVIGGWAGGPALDVNEVYDTVTDTWTTAAPMPTARGEMGVVTDGVSIWTIGGSLPAFGNSTDENEVFTP